MLGVTDDLTQKPLVKFPCAPNVPNTVLVKVEYAEGKYGPQLCFNIRCETEEGESNMKDWRGIPVLGEVLLRDDEDDQAAYERSCLEFNTVTRHYMTVAADYDSIAATLPITEDAAAFGEATADAINLYIKQNGSATFYSKTFKTDKGYAKMSKFTPFLQRMSDGPGTMEYSKWEKEQMEKNANVTPPESGALVEITEEVAGASDVNEFLTSGDEPAA